MHGDVLCDDVNIGFMRSKKTTKDGRVEIKLRKKAKKEI
jgi:hypothetical protein